MSLNGKSILITGGTGSFGNAFIRLALREYDPAQLIVFSRDELKQFEMAQIVRDPRVKFYLGDVRDMERLKRAFEGVDYVVHAAALKQVVAAEHNPFECIKTNVLGAQNVIEAAFKSRVQRIVALSTDKAANPVNLYGATKLCSDKLFVAGNSYVGTDRNLRMAVVRYGNVLGSRGSLLPVFRELRPTGRLPITDPRMTRFWITLDASVRFVIAAFDRMHGGELFVPKIPTTDLLSMAEAIAPECELDIIGIRPGEKLHELMIGEDDARRTQDMGSYYVVQPDFPWWDRGTFTTAGAPVPDGFSYRSETNPNRLTVDEIRAMIEKSDADAKLPWT